MKPCPLQSSLPDLELLHLPRGATVSPLHRSPVARSGAGGAQLVYNQYGDNYGFDDFVESVGEAQDLLERRGVGNS